LKQDWNSKTLPECAGVPPAVAQASKPRALGSQSGIIVPPQPPGRLRCITLELILLLAVMAILPSRLGAQNSTPAKARITASSSSRSTKKRTTHKASGQTSKHRYAHSASTRRSSQRQRTAAARQRRAQLRPEPERIQEIQKALAQAGYLTGEPSGRWDDSTRDAMRRFQASHGFPATGLPEARSLMKLGMGPHPLPDDLDTNSGAAAASVTPSTPASATPPTTPAVPDAPGAPDAQQKPSTTTTPP